MNNSIAKIFTNDGKNIKERMIPFNLQLLLFEMSLLCVVEIMSMYLLFYKLMGVFSQKYTLINIILAIMVEFL